jgi:hypothetical protein
MDSDCGVNSIVNYTLEYSINVAEHFVVHSDTGNICIKAPLDRETVAFHELLIIATDRGL